MTSVTTGRRRPLIDGPGALRHMRPVPPRQAGGRGFDALVPCHEPWLRVLATRLAGNRAEADDLVQDTLERALKAWSQFDEDTNVRAWLATILNHLFLDRCRRHTRVGSPLAIEEVAERIAQTPPEPEPAWADLSEADVRAALVHVQPEFREVFTLHLDGLSYQAIATRLGIPRPTVGTRLLRARRQVRAALVERLGVDAHG